MNNKTTQLFAPRTTNGSTQSFPSQGRFVTVAVQGTWGGATITIEASPNDGTTWIATDVTFTADGVKNFVTSCGFLYRATLSGVTTTSVNLWIGYGDES